MRKENFFVLFERMRSFVTQRITNMRVPCYLWKPKFPLRCVFLSDGGHAKKQQMLLAVDCIQCCHLRFLFALILHVEGTITGSWI